MKVQDTSERALVGRLALPLFLENFGSGITVSDFYGFKSRGGSEDDFKVTVFVANRLTEEMSVSAEEYPTLDQMFLFLKGYAPTLGEGKNYSDTVVQHLRDAHELYITQRKNMGAKEPSLRDTVARAIALREGGQVKNFQGLLLRLEMSEDPWWPSARPVGQDPQLAGGTMQVGVPTDNVTTEVPSLDTEASVDVPKVRAEVTKPAELPKLQVATFSRINKELEGLVDSGRLMRLGLPGDDDGRQILAFMLQKYWGDANDEAPDVQARVETIEYTTALMKRGPEEGGVHGSVMSLARVMHEHSVAPNEVAQMLDAHKQVSPRSLSTGSGVMEELLGSVFNPELLNQDDFAPEQWDQLQSAWGCVPIRLEKALREHFQIDDADELAELLEFVQRHYRKGRIANKIRLCLVEATTCGWRSLHDMSRAKGG